MGCYTIQASILSLEQTHYTKRFSKLEYVSNLEIGPSAARVGRFDNIAEAIFLIARLSTFSNFSTISVIGLNLLWIIAAGLIARSGLPFLLYSLAELLLTAFSL